ncbi:YdcF family protein [Cyclobacterium sp. SYSU L10401]|uniref:YdcF family protein n=1 Tax=Cyclobacterium sp. SYSU L10401 TaxID=2678657 RepID=UPI0013D7222D|nr:YdcF family protein [Cyclobacterium sp. SYSU L10401]
MIFILKSLFNHFLLNPAFWLFLVLAGGAVKSFKQSKARALLCALLALGLFSPFSHWATGYMERQYPVLDLEAAALPEMLLVLGSGGTPDPDVAPSHRVGLSALPRVLEAFRIWKRHPEIILVVSSSGREGYPSQAAIYAEALQEWGVPATQIRLLETPTNTLEEARHFKALFPEQKNLILVSAALHLPRAVQLFKAEGLHPLPAPCGFHVLNHPAGTQNWWVPGIQSLGRWQALLHEWVGMGYGMVGGI